jgi:transposase
LCFYNITYFPLLQIINHLNQDKKRIAELETKVIQLEAIIVQLIEKIETLMHSKNRRNSSVPPSKDENRPLKKSNLTDNFRQKIRWASWA